MFRKTMVIVSIKLPKEVVELLDTLVRNSEYYSRSQIMRKALLEYLKNNTTDHKIPKDKIQRAIKALEAITY